MPPYLGGRANTRLPAVRLLKRLLRVDLLTGLLPPVLMSGLAWARQIQEDCSFPDRLLIERPSGV